MIDYGLNALKTENKKKKARGNFAAAGSLAKEYDLNTTKADEAYNYAMSKGNALYERNAPDGAKEWYEVAQSLKDTEEVRRKIKQCTNLAQ